MSPDGSASGGGNRSVKWATRILAILIWIVTSVFGLVEIYLARQASVRIYGRFATDPYAATTIGNVVTLIMALAWLGYVVIAGEYNLKRIETGKGWSLYAWAVAIELLILILYLVA
ncbi:MAG TPA: hypothetical protein PJ988_10155 [Anaerolinea sp.]|nr:hypothetical protein [Anaerolinea sp.]